MMRGRLPLQQNYGHPSTRNRPKIPEFPQQPIPPLLQRMEQRPLPRRPTSSNKHEQFNKKQYRNQRPQLYGLEDSDVEDGIESNSEEEEGQYQNPSKFPKEQEFPHKYVAHSYKSNKVPAERCAQPPTSRKQFNKHHRDGLYKQEDSEEEKEFDQFSDEEDSKLVAGRHDLGNPLFKKVTWRENKSKTKYGCPLNKFENQEKNRGYKSTNIYRTDSPKNFGQQQKKINRNGVKAPPCPSSQKAPDRRNLFACQEDQTEQPTVEVCDGKKNTHNRQKYNLSPLKKQNMQHQNMKPPFFDNEQQNIESDSQDMVSQEEQLQTETKLGYNQKIIIKKSPMLYAQPSGTYANKYATTHQNKNTSRSSDGEEFEDRHIEDNFNKTYGKQKVQNFPLTTPRQRNPYNMKTTINSPQEDRRSTNYKNHCFQPKDKEISQCSNSPSSPQCQRRGMPEIDEVCLYKKCNNVQKQCFQAKTPQNKRRDQKYDVSIKEQYPSVKNSEYNPCDKKKIDYDGQWQKNLKSEQFQCENPTIPELENNQCQCDCDKILPQLAEIKEQLMEMHRNGIGRQPKEHVTLVQNYL